MNGTRPRHASTPEDLDTVVDRLAGEFAGVFSYQTVDDVVSDSRDRLGHVRISTYVGLLTYRFARERLRATAVGRHLVARDQPEVLFVCTHNSARSQLAQALLENEAAGRVVVRSAGSAPAEAIDPHVVEALAEVGISVDEAYPKPLVVESVEAADVVVTMGCGDACPVLPGKRYLDWDLPDPAGTDLPTVRAVRDEIRALVVGLLDDLLHPSNEDST